MSYPPPSGPWRPDQPDQPDQPEQPPYEPRQQEPHWGHQPPYTPQTPYGQYGPPTPARPGTTNVLAVLSLVFAFVFAPAGIVLGHLAKRQIRTTGEEGDQLATWGLVLSYIITVLGVLICCGWVAVVLWASSDGTYT